MPRGIELLHPVGEDVGDVHVARRVGGDAYGAVHRTAPTATGPRKAAGGDRADPKRAAAVNALAPRPTPATPRGPSGRRPHKHPQKHDRSRQQHSNQTARADRQQTKPTPATENHLGSPPILRRAARGRLNYTATYPTHATSGK